MKVHTYRIGLANDCGLFITEAENKITIEFFSDNFYRDELKTEISENVLNALLYLARDCKRLEFDYEGEV